MEAGLAFTGSSEVGEALLRYSGESNMKPVSLECGGKSPNVILADTPDLRPTIIVNEKPETQPQSARPGWR
jgi:acyl-CoA reductase-like NAD-dependent aldehyde dehydrogenase